MATADHATVEDWARAYVEATDLAHKLDPGPPPRRWAEGRAALRLAAPGRPPELVVAAKARRSLRRHELREPRKRAQLVHVFLHHELQAAELMAWALLAFPGTPPAFRRGLLGILGDELRHMRLYAGHLAALGAAYGDFPVRDWFWQRVASCATPLQFVALLGIGLEGGNLDHARRYERWFAEVGDDEGARLQRLVGDEEVAHVRFAIRWFRAWSGGLAFEDWRRALVEPLTPSLMRGKELARAARQAAGFDEGFLRELEQWDDASPGC
ncbi:MAG: DUF455 family protein [Planctomycetota bacterium]